MKQVDEVVYAPSRLHHDDVLGEIDISGEWPQLKFEAHGKEMVSMVSVKHRDIVDELKEYIVTAKETYRPGSADSSINPFAIPVQLHTGVLERAIAEIERLRLKAGAVTDGEFYDSFPEIKRLARAVDPLLNVGPYKGRIVNKGDDNSLIAADRIVDKPSDTE